MKVFVVLLALTSVLCADEFAARVVSITDGDTLAVLRDKQRVRVRLHGIDSPERAQPYGTRARQFTGELAHQQEITVPQPLAALALQNKRQMYGLLFRATAETLQSIAADPKHLGAQIGFFCILHTWRFS